jgi:cytosine/adenosine deaminase-related metal-dependent hydrolase
MAEQTQVDLLIKGGVVITVDAGRQIYDPGCVAIADGKIVAVDSTGGAYSARERIDASEMVVMPGLVNPHNHLDQSVYRSCFDRPQSGESLSFWHMALGLTRKRAWAAATLLVRATRPKALGIQYLVQEMYAMASNG